MARGKYRVVVVGGCGMWGALYTKGYVEHEDCDVILGGLALE